MTFWLIVSEARKRTDKRISRDGVDRWLGLSNYFSTGPAASRRGKARPVASMILDNPYLRGSTYQTGKTAKQDLDYRNRESDYFFTILRLPFLYR